MALGNHRPADSLPAWRRDLGLGQPRGLQAIADVATRPVTVAVPPAIPSKGADSAVVAAIDRERQAVLAEPTSPDRWGALGMTLLAHEFDQPAGECFSQAAALDPQDARWPYLHAHALLDTAPEDAVELLQQAVQLVGNDPGAVRLTLCELLLQLHQLDEAERQLNAYLIDHRGDVRARLAQARLEFMRGDNQVCLDHLEKLVDYARRHDNVARPHAFLVVADGTSPNSTRTDGTS